MNCKLEFGEACNIGLIRTNNEDTTLSSPDYGLWLIADGMGGHDAGEIASQIVKDSVLESIQNGKKLKESIEKSHFDVKHAAANNIGSPNMGTTIVALLSHGSHYQIGWVGDSRAYLWNANDSMLRQISKDHSYVQALVDAGTISKADMDTHPQRNIITQSLGVSELESVAVDILEGEWHPGDKILLCSDGLTDLVSDSEIAHLFRKHRHQSNQALVDILINTALEKGGIDNVSVQIISAPENPSGMQDSESSQHRHLPGLIVLGTVLSAGLIWLLAR